MLVFFLELQVACNIELLTDVCPYLRLSKDILYTRGGCELLKIRVNTQELQGRTSRSHLTRSSLCAQGLIARNDQNSQYKQYPEFRHDKQEVYNDRLI